LPILALGLLGVTAYQLLFVLGVGRVTAGTAAMLIAANPVFAGLLARVFLRERLTPLAWCGIGVSVVGVALIALEKDIGGEFEGALLLILATLSISVYFVFQKPFFARHSPLSMTAWTSFAGTLPLLFYLPAALAARRMHRPRRCGRWWRWACSPAASALCCGCMRCQNCRPAR